ncbi:hypothetical protein EF294_11775 [Gordonia oryzae]|uniref:Uncharacterized protein n=1 Tax=Gordonia oryzae TaxID=2487349 RepID=A0A3N4GAU8_9ACTN|nr:hypothetical protein EF294_11775 [Gordonia oryzae]
MRHKLTSAHSTTINTDLRALTKRAYGFHTPGPPIAMGELARGGACPKAPWPSSTRKNVRRRSISVHALRRCTSSQFRRV